MMIEKLIQSKIAVYGLGITGKASVHYLSKHDVKPVIIDDAPEDKLQVVLKEFDGKYSAVYYADENRDWTSIFDTIDTMIISPGIKLPEEVDQIAIQKSVKIISEIEFAFQLCKGNIIAVTGSNGKSTTVTMIHEIFKEAGMPSHLLGNIGTPFIERVDDIHEGDWIVLELSSYQLERINKFKPQIALLTNITEDHLARHGDMKGYIAAKGRMFMNQDFNDHAIVNHQDFKTWKAFGKAITSMNAFTTEDMEELPKRELINGKEIQVFAALKNGILAFREGEEIIEILAANELKVVGMHNVENALVSALATYLAGVPVRSIKSALQQFTGIEHRIEFLGEFDGVKFFNDSKATNIDSTITALKTFPEGNLKLVLGGSEKGSDFEPLWEFLRDRDDPFTLYLTGPSGERMAKDLESEKWDFSYRLFSSFDECANAAIGEASETNIVLLSPACASFDEFPNFNERGKRFKILVSDFLGGKD